MDPGACLAKTSISSVGLVALLTRWAFASSNVKHCVGTPNEKDCANELFTCLLAAATDDLAPGEPLEVPLLLTNNWERFLFVDGRWVGMVGR